MGSRRTFESPDAISRETLILTLPIAAFALEGLQQSACRACER
jgi:hypothetical protein